MIQNYKLVSLLPIGKNIFEKLIINSLFKYSQNDNFLNSHQTGFFPCDSCVNQLLSITHDIYKSVNSNPSFEVRGIFLDLSKTLDRVWYEDIFLKSKRLGLSGMCYSLINLFYRIRHHRVVLDGHLFKWFPIKVGVPQASILGSLVF